MNDPVSQLARYAVAGNPVEHSRSPAIHGEFARQCGMDQAMSYERLLCPLDAFAATVQSFAAAGGRGCNITVPFKFEAHALAARLTQRAKLAGAVNTLRFDTTIEGGWLGDNTDGAGLVRDIEINAQHPLAGVRLLLLGAGGASAGVLGSLIAKRPTEICIANRSVDKAQALVNQHASWAAEHGVRLSARNLQECGRDYDVVINATSASLAGAGVPVSPEVLRPGALVLDMMYGPAAAPFLDWARQQGAKPRDGLGMLVEQAAEAFELWRGAKPDSGAVLSLLRQQACEAKP